VLETTPVSIDSALQRAHKTVEDRLPSQSQQQTLRLLGDEQLARSSSATSPPGSETTSTPSSRCSPRTPGS
jgi:hypothetical protein